MTAKKWPPTGFPIVQGDYALTPEWTITLPGKFARGAEDGSLILWRPGLTLWLNVWENDNNDPRPARLDLIKESASPDRFDERESADPTATRYSFRLHDENDDGPVESLYAFIIVDNGHLEVAVYFDAPTDEAEARKLAESIRPAKKT
jgi:hypothetical protein